MNECDFIVYLKVNLTFFYLLRKHSVIEEPHGN